jgi:hypothetical protein
MRMNNKIIELAYLRNQLISGKYTEDDKSILNDVKEKIMKLNSPFNRIAFNAILNCENDIKNFNFKLAALEIQLIHNFPFSEPQEWNSDYFYKVELLSYLEQIEDVIRIKTLIILLAQLQADILN